MDKKLVTKYLRKCFWYFKNYKEILKIYDKSSKLEINKYIINKCLSILYYKLPKRYVLDHYVYENTIGKIPLIKMDVEGFEVEALKGVEKTIKENKPVLIIAAYHKDYDILKIPKLIKSIVPEYKFKFVNLGRNHPIFERVVIAYC